MKTTGIVRRVDDLGRIVIPREFRRAYDINIGDPIEITADGSGNITLKRVDVISEFKRVGEGVASFLSEQFGWTVLLSDRESFIAGCGKRKGLFVGKEITLRLKGATESGKASLGTPTEFFGDDAAEFAGAASEPIRGDRGPIGALSILSDKTLDGSELHIIALSARLVANNMQKY